MLMVNHTSDRNVDLLIKPSTMRKWAGLLVLICCVPLVLLALGVDLSTSGQVPSLDSLSKANLSDAAHHMLRGSFSHTILEWTAVCLAAFVAVLSFIHYR